MDSAYTDSKGDYVTKEKSMDGAIDWVHKEKRLKVILEDVDGGANGGEFATDTIKSENITVEQSGKRSQELGIGALLRLLPMAR